MCMESGLLLFNKHCMFRETKDTESPSIETSLLAYLIKTKTRAPPMRVHKYVDRNGSAAMLATKRSAGVTPEVNLRECVTYTPLQSANKAAHSGFETQRRRHQKSKTGVSVAPQKGLMFFKHFKKSLNCNQANTSGNTVADLGFSSGGHQPWGGVPTFYSVKFSWKTPINEENWAEKVHSSEFCLCRTAVTTCPCQNCDPLPPISQTDSLHCRHTPRLTTNLQMPVTYE